MMWTARQQKFPSLHAHCPNAYLRFVRRACLIPDRRLHLQCWQLKPLQQAQGQLHVDCPVQPGLLSPLLTLLTQKETETEAAQSLSPPPIPPQRCQHGLPRQAS